MSAGANQAVTPLWADNDKDNICLPPEQMQAEFKSIIEQRKVTTYFQPIVNLQTGEILGYEALSRGPENSLFHSPAALFAAANKLDMLTELEQLCQETALQAARKLDINHTLFINISSRILQGQTEMSPSMSQSSLLEANRTPNNIVFEISEEADSDIGSLRLSIGHYRRQGFTIAVDDAGSSYSGLHSIVEIRPEYIKLDRSLIKDIAQTEVKQSLIRSMVEFAQSVNAKVIAEGVESYEELDALLKAGVIFGQGYLIAHPAPTLDELNGDYLIHIQKNRHANGLTDNSPTFGVSVGDIVQSCPTVSKNTLICQVEQIMINESHGVVVVDDLRPVGLLMKNKLYFQLGTQFGVSLYHRRPVEKIMDRDPLIVSADLPLEAVSKAAMARKENNIYDLIIVVKDNKFVGAISIIHLLKHLTQLQIQCAYNASPLTGLPGNLLIDERLRYLVENKEPFAILYIDLDNFKAFNDKYGFKHGDKALLLTANILGSCLTRYGSSTTRDFLGHIGGDDFIIISTPEKYKQLAECIIEDFDKQIISLYSQEDTEKGYIKVTTRQGKKEKIPIMTVSIAIVTNEYRTFKNHLEIGEAAAEVKKKAKSVPESVWFVDKRKE